MLVAALVAALAWQSAPAIRDRLLPRRPEPRVVAARGELADDERATIALFEAARPSVVYISTAERSSTRGPATSSTCRAAPAPASSGTTRGHIVTNYHVIAGAPRPRCVLADGEAYPAALVGRDPRHDLAVLQIPAGADPPPLAIGSSADLQVGQKVFAIGNPVRARLDADDRRRSRRSAASLPGDAARRSAA